MVSSWSREMDLSNNFSFDRVLPPPSLTVVESINLTKISALIDHLIETVDCPITAVEYLPSNSNIGRWQSFGALNPKWHEDIRRICLEEVHPKNYRFLEDSLTS